MYSKRIEALADFVDEKCNLADVGGDHGYLLILLRERLFSGLLLGIENKKGPFLSLSKNISNCKYSKSIKLSFSDGLDEITNEYDTVVMAGMGFDNINKIIQKNTLKLDSIKAFIIDAHTKIPDLRMFFDKLGYYISREIIIFEDGIFYEIIKFEKGHKEYLKSDYEFGPILRINKGDLFIKKYENQIINYEKMLSNITNESIKKEIKEKIDEIKENL